VSLALEPYQQLAKKFLIENDRAALFMGMGMGKSATTLSALHDLMLDGACTGALIVAPLRVATLTWPHEVQRWFPNLRIANLRTVNGMETLKRGGAHLYTINYESLPKLAKTYFYNRRQLAFDTVVFDELTMAKNPSSKRIRAIRPYLPKLTRRWGLTGTPTPNGLLDLWAQIYLLDDGETLGRSISLYRETYFTSDYMGYKWEMRPGAEAQIQQKLSRIALTLRASDYLDVPDTVYEDVEVPLPATARKVYDELEEQLLVMLSEHEAEVVAVNAAVLVNKLLQITGGAIYDADKRALPLHTAKLDALAKLVAKVKEPVLIACNFIHEKDRIVRAIPGCVEWSDGILDLWNSGKVKAIVAHPKSIGHGLNLQQGGRTIVWFSRTWSREQYDQFNARVARKGQGKVPQVFHLVCPDTADEAVAEALRMKGDGQAALFAALKSIQELCQKS